MNPATITAQTLDVRDGKALTQASDEIRARAIGATTIEWWTRGGPDCFVNLWNRDRTTSHRIDLRVELLRALQVGRRSASAGILSISHGFAMVSAKPGREAIVGSDMIDWFTSGHHISRQGLDLRVQVNQAVERMQARASG